MCCAPPQGSRGRGSWEGLAPSLPHLRLQTSVSHLPKHRNLKMQMYSTSLPDRRSQSSFRSCKIIYLSVSRQLCFRLESARITKTGRPVERNSVDSECTTWKKRTVSGGQRRLRLIGAGTGDKDDICLLIGILIIIVDKHLVLRELGGLRRLDLQ